MNGQKLYSYTRKAIEYYDMIQDGDKIAIGVSGGKDSLALVYVYALAGLKKFMPRKFEIIAITVDLGFGNQNFEAISDYCSKFDVDYYVIKTEISDIVFEKRKESNPCSLCAKLRKGALDYKAKELGCNKVAYGHHKDDVVETMMLSLMFEGRFHCFSPVTYLEKMELTLIRPFIYISEGEIIGFAKKYDLPVAKNPCPVDGHTKREYVKNIIKSLNKDNPGCRDRMFKAISNTFDKNTVYIPKL